MPVRLEAYFEPILQACLVFPLVAALFTLPFMVVNYRKYGGIALMRVLVVYSFILYSLCAFLLTVLPLPSREAVAAMDPRPIIWTPFTELIESLQKAGLTQSGALGDLSLWKNYFTSAGFFQIMANIIMQVPLGFYLRYYFRCSWKKTLLIGFLVSLFYELTQLSGLFFIYPKAYRFASVDDLINNSLGALLGWGITPLLAMLLPSREEIDRISYRKGEHLTLIRRMLAAVLDVGGMAVLAIGVSWLPVRITTAELGMGSFALCFVLVPWLTHGRTAGQALLRLRVVGEDGHAQPGLIQLLVRNVLLYVLEPMLAFVDMLAVLGIVIVLTAEGLELTVLVILLGGCLTVLLATAWFFLRCQVRWNTFPHGHYSHTTTVRDEPPRRGEQP